MRKGDEKGYFMQPLASVFLSGFPEYGMKAQPASPLGLESTGDQRLQRLSFVRALELGEEGHRGGLGLH